ncbi:MAG TPA: glycosyltransferase family 2 protein [Chitinophagaceae bacterium]|jgi:cellulose synthase/poly-beta-1,6-N-acetylglucosamine synthase-like glycosyltransferase|nr:glycosyltransferase family 2 protein [Chitinophagaceae bacterium]
MMDTLIIFFWISLSILFYCYIGYGVLMFVWVGMKRLIMPRKKKIIPADLPSVTLIVTAYNEEKILAQKIKNTLTIDYPAEKLQLIFVTDGSIDESVKIIQQYPSILLMHQSERKGKYAAIKRAMHQVRTPLVIFSDANTMVNEACVKKMVTHYSDEGTGGVAGEKKILRSHEVSAVGEAEGLYWQYESFMKQLDAGLNTVTGAAGELFSIRSALFKELKDDLILDDFVISMQICLQGYKIGYEPGAFAIELPSASLAEEEKRKVRISAGAYQSVGYLKECLNVFKHPLLCFQYLSRRLLRWIFCPLMLIVLLLSDSLIVAYHSQPAFYSWLLYTQIVFYISAFAGWLFVRAGKRCGIFAIPFYFVFMNYCLVKGFFKFVKGRQSVLWEKSMRQVVE